MLAIVPENTIWHLQHVCRDICVGTRLAAPPPPSEILEGYLLPFTASLMHLIVTKCPNFFIHIVFVLSLHFSNQIIIV